MHGRVKVKTSEEKQKAKAEKRARQAAQLCDVTARLVAKRDGGDFGATTLQLTTLLLSECPEFYSWWTVRTRALREAVDVCAEVGEGGTPEEGVKKAQDLFDNERQFLNRCLANNPKSYSIWNHRYWLYDTFVNEVNDKLKQSLASTTGADSKLDPRYEQEKVDCDRFLTFDDRNFHGWDYLRFLQALLKTTSEEKLVYADSCIERNLSNFSAWHFRGQTLLDTVGGRMANGTARLGGGALLAKALRVKELATATSAVFTEPNEQSSWWYYQWLVGQGAPLSGQPLWSTCREDRDVVEVFFSHPVLELTTCAEFNEVLAENGASFKISSDHGDITVVGPGNARKTMWKVTPFREELIVSHNGEVDGTTSSFVCKLQRKGELCGFIRLKVDGCNSGFGNGEELLSIFDVEQESLETLLEVEPDLKWALLALIQLKYQRLIVSTNNFHSSDDLTAYIGVLEEGVQAYERVINLDPCRNGYYLDVRSDFVFWSALARLPSSVEELDLRGKNLTRLQFSISCRNEFSPPAQLIRRFARLKKLYLHGNPCVATGDTAAFDYAGSELSIDDTTSL